MWLKKYYQQKEKKIWMVLQEKLFNYYFVSLATVTLLVGQRGKGVYVFHLSQPGWEVIRGEPLGAIRIPHANTRSSELRSPGSIPKSRFQEDSRAI